ncbi:CDP-alcohol phosphatidyltransferase family protein [Legionella sp. km772]|uniref:CDP-alcohol phosphatidyltransferase family protein n=1 Tax=Legionella sp. km772 TaxID=2498111 RepID=UPI000F8E0C1C|nr:CDP-alcohol phosphatidyltransferase family protein [Legionella sp. km772]RUR11159.1 CDP-alcohol phosphatidyltransferase family protein [Legionella sp. km772]
MNTNKTKNIFLLLPNLICYLRLISLLLCLYMLKQTQHPLFWIVVLGLSDCLDALDGYLARRFNLVSQLGQILDYTCDRLALSGAMFLCALYFSNYWFFFLLISLLDIASHYIYLKASYLAGKDNHKSLNASMPKLLHYYYGSRIALFSTCFIHDFFIGMLLVYHYYPNNWVKLLLLLTLPWFIFKIVIHMIQLHQALLCIGTREVMPHEL